MEITLLPIDKDGCVRGYRGPLPEVAIGVCSATAQLYRSAGFEEPWTGYLAFEGSQPVGTCGFKSPPANGRVEIAYFSFPGSEGRGLATSMAASLLDIARQHDATVTIAAQTLPDRNASHRVLEKLGFEHVDTLVDPEDGNVWEWRRKADTGSGPG